MALVPIQCFCCCLLSITIGIICCKIFGPELKASVLLNFESSAGVLSIVLRSSFALLIISQIPYIMLPLKQSCLVLIEEVFYSKISKKLLNNQHTHILRSHRETPRNRGEETDRLINDSLDSRDNIYIANGPIATISLLEEEKITPYLRYSVTVGVQVMVTSIALLVTDLTKIFDYANCFGVSILFLILPSVFVLMALKSFPKGLILA
jgi:hypothetical protein